MPETDLILAFFVATAIFAYMPGPSTLYAAAQTMARGRRAGWYAALGIHTGGYVHVIAAALGLAVLFEAVPVMYLTLKLAGAAYLIFLGLKMFLAASADVTVTRISEKGPRRAFWESVTVEVLNPKTAIFYVAFLPQFVSPEAGLAIWAQLLLLGTVVNVMFSSADVICVVLADKVTRWMRQSDQMSRILQRMGGGILVALGVKLAFSRG